MASRCLLAFVFLSVIGVARSRTFDHWQINANRLCKREGIKTVGADQPKVCISKYGNKCNHERAPPTCEEIRARDKDFGQDNGDLCDQGFWLAPPAADPNVSNLTFPVVIAGNIAHNNACSGEPKDNSHWHAFCWVEDGTMERVYTIYKGGENPLKVWESAMLNACCPDWGTDEDIAFMKTAAWPNLKYDNPDRADPKVCTSQDGNKCTGKAPTCKDMKTFKGLEKNGAGLCDEIMLSPEDGSNFPLAVSISVKHKKDTNPNWHWHPFCMTKNGIERIASVNATTTDGIWKASAASACCPQYPAGVPKSNWTDFSSDVVATTSGAVASQYLLGCMLVISSTAAAAFL